MIIDQVGALLKVLAAYDGRNVGEADLMVWGRQMADVEYADAVEAAHQHYAESREWARPSDIRHLAQGFYNRRHRRLDVPRPGCVEPDPNERRRLVQAEDGLLALPSRYEDDGDRDARNHENAMKIRREVIAPLVAKMAVPAEWSASGKDPSGAWWEDPDRRERHAKQELAALGRLRPAQDEDGTEERTP